jgi:phage-related baseplate assembly protein
MSETIQPPQFVEVDPARITRDLIADYEARTGRTLYPAQPERIWLDLLAYRETLLRQAIQHAAEMSLVRWATGPYLEELGVLVGVTRLAARPAEATWTVTRTAPPTGSLTVPIGTEATIHGTQVRFTTTADLVLGDGVASGTVRVQAVEPGPEGNDWAVGTPLTLTVPISGVASVVFASVPAGGAEIEDDARLRERIILAPEAFSVAGPAGAYRFWALSAHRDIVDVSVGLVAPGHVLVTVLAAVLPVPAAILDAVAATLSDESVRPLCDTVTVQGATAVDYAIAVELIVLQHTIYPEILSAAQATLAAYAEALRRRLGADLVPAHLIGQLRQIPGVHDVVVVQPAARVLSGTEVAVLTGTPTVTITGEVEG